MNPDALARKWRAAKPYDPRADPARWVVLAPAKAFSERDTGFPQKMPQSMTRSMIRSA
jgi:hypothetical protein